MPLLIPTCLLLLVLMSSGSLAMMEDNDGDVAHGRVNHGSVVGGSSFMGNLPWRC